MADTIANIEESIDTGSRMLRRYLSEFEYFRDHIYSGVLRDEVQEMFKHYEALIVASTLPETS